MPLSETLNDPAIDAILSPVGRDEARRIQQTFPGREAAATELARRGWVTPLQARWMAHGKFPAVGPYVLVRRLSRGAFGDVHLARHRHLPRPIALKTLRSQPDDARAVERFQREAEALGQIDHPNVAHAYDSGVSAGVRWLAMEYVSGPDLARVLREDGPLEPGRACEYARQAAIGLAHLHDRGLIHRDVKPSNLALADDGRVVKVLDMGLSRSRSVDAGAGATGGGCWSELRTVPPQSRWPTPSGPASGRTSMGSGRPFTTF